MGEENSSEKALNFAIDLVRRTGHLLDVKTNSDLAWSGREPKARLDVQLQDFLMPALADSGIPVISEEAESPTDWRQARKVWIIDPLDGTLNHLRGSGPSAISVALWGDGQPLFGIVLDCASRELAWGGRGFGARLGEQPISVSDFREIAKATLCTGIPSAFDWKDQASVSRLNQRMSAVAKVRMIGSAASSLVLVARGAAEVYAEDSVRIWDVAAGLAIVEGAGGGFEMSRLSRDKVSIVAANGLLHGCFAKGACETDFEEDMFSSLVERERVLPAFRPLV